jgi:hypothetical protein
MYGLVLKYIEDNDPRYIIKSTTYCYINSITIPLHIKFCKPIGKGSYTCTFGPYALLPVNEFYKTTDVQVFGNAESSQSGHQIFGKSSVTGNSGLGFDIKMGYEKQLTKQISVDICPIISFINLPLFTHRIFIKAQIPDVFQSYIGLDVAFNFGLKK